MSHLKKCPICNSIAENESDLFCQYCGNSFTKNKNQQNLSVKSISKIKRSRKKFLLFTIINIFLFIGSFTHGPYQYFWFILFFTEIAYFIRNKFKNHDYDLENEKSKMQSDDIPIFFSSNGL